VTPELEIHVAQIRDHLGSIGEEIARLVTDAYALGRCDGLAEARAEGGES
jgi:hypothetical protein